MNEIVNSVWFVFMLGFIMMGMGGLMIVFIAWFVRVLDKGPLCPCCEAELHVIGKTWGCTICGYNF